MKLVEAFLFSEAHELDVLWLKFILSSNKIDAWIICENAYSHQGEYKGVHAKRLLHNDERFAPFLNKITFVEGKRFFYLVDKTQKQDHLAFECENWQRQLAYDVFFRSYNDEDWLIIHDADEMMDFTDSNRWHEFTTKLQANISGLFFVPRLRYWYDFDNQYPNKYSSVLASKKYLQLNPQHSLPFLRRVYTNAKYSAHWQHIIVFEYSTCFHFSHIVRKLDTNPHTGINKNDLKRALLCNHRTIRLNEIKKINPKKDFFTTIILSSQNSPAYVREHLQSLKTNVVSTDYKCNRQQFYPYLYTVKYKINTIVNVVVQPLKAYFKTKKKNLAFRVSRLRQPSMLKG